MVPDRQISVIIPCRDSLASLTQTLTSLTDLSLVPSEIIIIDDGSLTALDLDQKPLEIVVSQLRDMHVAVRTLRLDPGCGPAAARNAGAAQASGDILLFVDADVLVHRHCLQRIQDAFNNQPEIAAVQGLYSASVPDGHSVTSSYQNHYYHFAFKTIDGDYPAVCATYCFAIRRNVFIGTGGFDASILCPTVEDEAFGYHLAGQGHKIYLHRGVRVTHLAEYSPGSLIRRKFRMSFNQVKSVLRGVKPPIQGDNNKTHHSRDFLVAVVLAPMLPILLFWSWPALLVGLLAYTACNARFWSYLYREEAPVYFAEMCFLTWIDQVTIFSGLSAGVIDYFMGRKV